MNKAVLEPLLRSPELVEHVEALNRVMAAESQRRRKFHEEISEERKWEFINGEVIMHSPAANRHNRIAGRLFRLLSLWVDSKQLGQVTIEKTLCQFPRNDYEPDIAFYGAAKAANIRADTLLHPIPDMVVEALSATTEARDRGVKFEDYMVHGVGEYWIIDPGAETLEAFVLSNGSYPSQVERMQTGIAASQAVAGFEIPVRAIFDDAENISAVRRLLAET